jgi:hypothetical protein
MGITAITGLTPLPTSRFSESSLEPISRIENSARIGDVTYSPSNGKSGRGSEDDGSEDEFEDLDEEVEEDKTDPTVRPVVLKANRPISFFA